MISFLNGQVESIDLNSIELNVNGVGYYIYVSNSEFFSLNEEIKIFTYQHVREDEISLYGFREKEEKEVFLSLISVKGVGVKSALSILSKSSPSLIIQAIETSNINYLKKLPTIGPKVAQQIILDLKGHLKLDNQVLNLKDNKVFKEAKEALKALNFKSSEIDEALSKINDENIKLDACIFKALQFLNRK